MTSDDLKKLKVGDLMCYRFANASIFGVVTAVDVTSTNYFRPTEKIFNVSWSLRDNNGFSTARVESYGYVHDLPGLFCCDTVNTNV